MANCGHSFGNAVTGLLGKFANRSFFGKAADIDHSHRYSLTVPLSIMLTAWASMSSIKRDVKKKTSARPEWRFFLEIQPTVVSSLADVGRGKNQFAKNLVN
jgi:hypothetical protein